MKNRDNPSARYGELIGLYTKLHKEGEHYLGLAPDSTYPGISLLPHIHRIKALIGETGARTILDYGSGKGLQYEPRPIRLEGVGVWDSVLDYWDVDEVRCYDPCYEPYSRLPEGKFDGVVCTDVLEHCIEEDLPWIVDELFSYATRFVFASIACYPAKTRLPNGENAHCTVRSVEWWRALIAEIAGRYPGVKFTALLQELPQAAGGGSS